MTWLPLVPSTPYKHGTNIQLTLPSGEEQFMNDKYVVYRRLLKSSSGDLPDAIHLSIRRQDRQPCHDWRDFQRIKNQLAGPEWEAMEIYPAESRLVDGANQYHLWCFDFDLGVGFANGRVVADAAMAHEASPGAVQRDFEPVDLQYGGLSPLEDIFKDNPADEVADPGKETA
jgi:hypothetical protein